MASLRVTFTLIGDRDELLNVRQILLDTESYDPTSYMDFDPDRDSMELGNVEDAA